MPGACSDFLVVGGGVIGLNVARELKRRFADCSVTVLEKETTCGRHASGRNSGVLHAGFYYTADSLKARFTRDGNRELTAYCEARGVPINHCGKLVVAQCNEDLAGLGELERRARLNGVELHAIDERTAHAIEPRARTVERALYSPSTASVDPAVVMEQMEEDARAEGVAIRCGVRYLGRAGGGIRTDAGFWEAGYVVNAAGLHADRVARDFGHSEHYRILPFKGLYLYSDEPAGSFRTNIYPVPDLRNPFLGVHFTVTADGRAKIGPTAIPALWREQYAGTGNFNASELLDIARRQAGLAVSAGFDFVKLAFEELRKYSRGHLVALAARLADGVRPEQYRRWGRPGIRAQLVDLRKRRLEMDFVIEGDERSFHVLNAVSPAFTCSLPFSRFVVSEIAARLH